MKKEIDEKIIQMRQNGKQYWEIREILGIRDSSYIAKVLKKAGLTNQKRRKRNNINDPEIRKGVILMRQNGKKYREIMEALNINHPGISKILHEAGLTKNSRGKGEINDPEIKRKVIEMRLNGKKYWEIIMKLRLKSNKTVSKILTEAGLTNKKRPYKSDADIFKITKAILDVTKQDDKQEITGEVIEDPIEVVQEPTHELAPKNSVQIYRVEQHVISYFYTISNSEEIVKLKFPDNKEIDFSSSKTKVEIIVKPATLNEMDPSDTILVLKEEEEEEDATNKTKSKKDKKEKRIMEEREKEE